MTWFSVSAAVVVFGLGVFVGFIVSWLSQRATLARLLAESDRLRDDLDSLTADVEAAIEARRSGGAS